MVSGNPALPAGALAATGALAACSTSFKPETCAVDAACGGAFVCGAEAVCVPPADAPLRIGMSDALSGPSRALGVGMELGVSGGVRGRPLVVDVRDDAYQPDPGNGDCGERYSYNDEYRCR
jgi:hypothetical protein